MLCGVTDLLDSGGYGIRPFTVAVPEAAVGLTLFLGCLRPLPLAQVASSATGSAPIAPTRFCACVILSERSESNCEAATNTVSRNLGAKVRLRSG